MSPHSQSDAVRLAALAVCVMVWLASVASQLAAQSGDSATSSSTMSSSESASTSSSSGGRWNVNWDFIDEDRATSSLVDVNGPLNVGGWMSAGITLNTSGNRSGDGNAPLPINRISDGPVLNQVWSFVEKPLNTDGGSWDWGGRVDFVFGTDAPEVQAGGDQGWDHGWNSSRDYGSAIPQLYLEIGNGDFTILGGYFIGLQGFEAAQAVDNFFYSHNYAFGYGVPGTHSGTLATYHHSDQWEFDLGWALGWDSWWSNYLSSSMVLGGVTWTPRAGRSLSYQVTAGDFGDGTAKNGAASNAGRLYGHAIVLTVDVTERGTYVLEHTLGSNTGLGDRNHQWYSLTNYLFYEVNPCLDAGARFEWFRDEDGQRVNTNGSGPGSFYEVTLGLNWIPHSNISFRPELRWDGFVGQGRPFDRRAGEDTGNATDQVTFGFDCVIQF